MAFDLAAWALIIVVAYAVGSRVVALLGADRLRRGDRFIIGTWIGVAVVAMSLLAASLVGPVSPPVSLVIGGALAALAAATRPRHHAGRASSHTPEAPTPRAAVIIGASLAAIGAAALTSDAVTLYDSLVYHIGIIGWLRDHGTVPGVALIHNRLGHVSAWFALGAAFDSGPAANRVANIPLGLALVLVALQGGIAVARIASRRGTESDWFLALTTAALLWAGVVANAATPSPDVATNVLIVLVAWSMLVVPRASAARPRGDWRHWFTPRLLPFLLAVAALGMKLFALPAAVAAALFYIFGRSDDGGAREAATRTAICAALGTVLLMPFLAANVVASGCPVFPSRLGCVPVRWSIGAAETSDYAAYIRDVARWESRRSLSNAAGLPWVGPWIAAHPLLTTLAVLAVPLAVALLRGPRRDGVRSAVLLAILGTAFVGWQAPAPRFLFAFVLIAPAVALAYPLSARAKSALLQHRPEAGRARAAVGFLSTTAVVAFGYAVASQKLNVRSSILRDSAALHTGPGELLLPAAPPLPDRLYLWRVNDIDILTPVPRPIADTLSFHSAIAGDVRFEQCSTAPLPCTPYLPRADVRLRVPERGVAGGFVREPGVPTFTMSRARCIRAVRHPVGLALAAPDPVSPSCDEQDDR